jgi:hypothetical protein
MRKVTPAWVHLVSWPIAIAVWFWVIKVTVLADWPPPGEFLKASATQLGMLALKTVPFLVIASVVAALALFLVRLIGCSVAWLGLRFVQGR